MICQHGDWRHGRPILSCGFRSLVLVTWLLWKKTGKRFLKSAFSNFPIRFVLVAVIALVWIGGSFWHAGGKKLYWDAKVWKLCAIDGGIRVYETVVLTPDLIDRFGQIFLRDEHGYYF
ncbi:hypothetical protein LZ24_03423 [Desulfobotulus alkaliphilus]|uniref:Uncharacterized protein n=1 Tax=Desulfobotulus alkaliphilus TaxID=622671 RepID=A0A562QY67_9BACT|nr:hypothetical protein LZ24_03423 [Desulfobotulus alkaliphilus]